MNYFRGFSVTAASMLLVYGLAFLNQSLLARVLSPEDFGGLAYWSTTIMFGALVLGEWLGRGSTYILGRESGNPAAIANGVAYCGLLAALVLAVAALRLVWEPAARMPLTWVLVGALTVSSTTQRVGQALLVGQDRIGRYAAVPLLATVLWLVGDLAGWACCRLDLDRALAVWLGALGISAVVAVVPGVRGPGRTRAVDGRLLLRTARIGARGAVSFVLIFLLFRSNIWLIQHLLGAAAVAPFRAATLFTEIMQRLPSVAGVVLLAKVVHGADDGEALSLPVAQAVLLFSLACALALAALGPLLVRVFVPRYPEAYGLILWLLPGLVFAGFGSVLNTRLAGEGYPAVTVWAPAAALVVAVGLGLWLIPAWGLPGAAIATSASLVLWSTAAAVIYFRRTGRGWLDLLRLGALRRAVQQR